MSTQVAEQWVCVEPDDKTVRSNIEIWMRQCNNRLSREEFVRLFVERFKFAPRFISNDDAEKQANYWFFYPIVNGVLGAGRDRPIL
jgi:hypothetical protein